MGALRAPMLRGFLAACVRSRFVVRSVDCIDGISPGKNPVDPIDLMIGNTVKHIGQPSLRIVAVELGSD